MELSQLEAFVAVAEAGGFSRAAARVGGSQPTLSRQVRALELQLGRPLFDRIGRRVELTRYGGEVLDLAREILSRTEALTASARLPPGAILGTLRIGAADSVVLQRFPKLIQRFRRRYPRVHPHLRTGLSPDILAWVREGRCDVGLCMLPETYPELALTEIWSDWYVAIAPPDHAFAGRRVPLSRFAAERQVAIEPGTLSNQVLVSTFHAAGLSFVPDMTLDSFQVICDLVGAGMGVGIVGGQVGETRIERGQVARVRIKEIDRLPRPIGIAVHAERAADRPLEAFLTELERE
jgi:DNA-binding transcriptional LysR family regulator